MICTALANLSFEESLKAVDSLELAEVRLDLLDLSEEEVSTIFSADCRLIATCRPGKYSEDVRKKLLLLAIEAGTSYVDIEVEAEDHVKQELIQAARAKGCQVIISYHNFEKTPERVELEHVIRWCSELKPDLIKLACMVTSPRDNARLLGLLDSDTPMLIVGMGEQGKLSRLISPLLGSFCTFASFAADKATAPGQMFKEELEELLQRLQNL
ncbi:MAG: type I 3-dehydroquinate dehydratase [bacterium]|nr:type I 3-dehydroquinate dehydratase [bacterium]